MNCHETLRMPEQSTSVAVWVGWESSSEWQPTITTVLKGQAIIMEYIRNFRHLLHISRKRLPIRCIQHHYCCKSSNSSGLRENRRVDKLKTQLVSGPRFEDFVKGVSINKTPVDNERSMMDKHTYLSEDSELGNARKGKSAQSAHSVSCCSSPTFLAKHIFFFLIQYALKLTAVKWMSMTQR